MNMENESLLESKYWYCGREQCSETYDRENNKSKKKGKNKKRASSTAKRIAKYTTSSSPENAKYWGRMFRTPRLRSARHLLAKRISRGYGEYKIVTQNTYILAYMYRY